MKKIFFPFLFLFITTACFSAEKSSAKKILTTDKNIIHLAMAKQVVLYTYKEGNQYFTVWGEKKFGPFDKASEFMTNWWRKNYAQIATNGKKSFYIVGGSIFGPFDEVGYHALSNNGTDVALEITEKNEKFILDGKKKYGPYPKNYKLDFFQYLEDEKGNDRRLAYKFYEQEDDEEYWEHDDGTKLFIDGVSQGDFSSIYNFIITNKKHIAYCANVQGVYDEDYNEISPEGTYVFYDDKKFGPYPEATLVNLSMDGSKITFPFKNEDGEQFIFENGAVLGPFDGQIFYTLYSEDGKSLFFKEQVEEKTLIHMGKQTYGPYEDVICAGLSYKNNEIYYMTQIGDEFTLYYKNKTYGPFYKEFISKEQFDYEMNDWRYVIQEPIGGTNVYGSDLYVGDKIIGNWPFDSSFICWAKDKKSFSYELFKVAEYADEEAQRLYYVQIDNKSYVGSIAGDGTMIYLKDGAIWIQ